MNIIIFPDQSCDEASQNGLPAIMKNGPGLIIEWVVTALTKSNLWAADSHAVILAVPEQWPVGVNRHDTNVVQYNRSIPFRFSANSGSDESWIILSDGRYASRFDHRWIYSIANEMSADIIAVRIDGALNAFYERLRITSRGNVVGMRRIYHDSAQTSPFPSQRPHHLFVKKNALDRLLNGGDLPVDFTEFYRKCLKVSLKTASLQAGGMILDLYREDEFLCFASHVLDRYFKDDASQISKSRYVMIAPSNTPASRCFGSIMMGSNVHIADKSIIVGPVLLDDNVKIGNAAVVRNSIIGPGCEIPPNGVVENRVLLKSPPALDSTRHSSRRRTFLLEREWADFSDKEKLRYKTWSQFTYARFFKRAADIIFASIVLILFAPVFPIIALAIRCNSSGPVFFRDRRQGRYGKEFYCLKFRSMKIDAAQNQKRLRIVNQVDGPQFKLVHDPRITPVGRFLRDTCIDEIPQFINVLLGQMSVVGPRPSPRFENALCAYWRDARLSVRPGITGFWQVCRTRTEGQDFQEWIYYDTEYVKKVSFWLDVWICVKTAIKILKDFIRQF
jgi:lipopolysaccharide/colanic/teichoic acid biosynthesis glycosyltransferase